MRPPRQPYRRRMNAAVFEIGTRAMVFARAREIDLFYILSPRPYLAFPPPSSSSFGSPLSFPRRDSRRARYLGYRGSPFEIRVAATTARRDAAAKIPFRPCPIVIIVVIISIVAAQRFHGDPGEFLKATPAEFHRSFVRFSRSNPLRVSGARYTVCTSYSGDASPGYTNDSVGFDHSHRFNASSLGSLD